MKNPYPDDSTRYLTSKENLPYTLDILQQGEEIRRRVLCDFWESVRDKLRGSVPKGFRSQPLQWTLWPDARKMDAPYAGLFCYPSQFGKQTQLASYYVSQHNESSHLETYFGLSWEQPVKSCLLKLPAVKSLIAHLSENDFRQTQWDLGWQFLFRNQNLDAFLLKYAQNADEVHRQIRESFWPFVKDTFSMMMKANEAVRRAT